MIGRSPRICNLLLCVSQANAQKLGWKWSSQDINWHPYVMLVWLTGTLIDTPQCQSLKIIFIHNKDMYLLDMVGQFLCMYKAWTVQIKEINVFSSSSLVCGTLIFAQKMCNRWLWNAVTMFCCVILGVYFLYLTMMWYLLSYLSISPLHQPLVITIKCPCRC